MSASGFEIASLGTPPTSLGTGGPNEGQPGTGGIGPDGKRLAGGSGPRGIESVIEYNGLYLNVRSWVDTFLVTTIGGLDDADVRDSRELNPGYHGETAFQGFYGGRTITLTGKIHTKTLFKMRDMQQALRQAFSQLDDDLPLIFRAPVPERDLQINCKKSQSIQMTDEQRTANHFERAFQVILRAPNPRFVSTVRYRSNILFNTTTYDGIAFTPINEGNFDAQPIIELTGPITNLSINNENNGDWLALTGPVPAGERWILDIEAHRMYRQSDEANRFMYLNVNSDWMELTPGKNSIRLTASALTAGTSQVTFYHRHTTM